MRRRSASSVGAVEMSPGFYDALTALARDLGVSPYDLAQVLYTESGLDPRATNKHGADKDRGAKGLNQLMPSTAKGLGMSDEEWADYENQPALRQLYWVKRYFDVRPVRGKGAVDIYAANFGDMRNPNGSLYDRNADAKGYPQPTLQRMAYDANKGLDITPGPRGERPKEYIDRADLQRFLRPLPSSVKSAIATADPDAAGPMPPYVPRASASSGSALPIVLGGLTAVGCYVWLRRSL